MLSFLLLLMLATADDCRVEFQACMQRAQTTEAQRACHVEAAACFHQNGYKT